MSLDVRIKKKLSRAFALEVDFSKGAGHLGILGPSGSGKSMTLKCIAGIETPDEGYIAVNGRVLFDSAAGVNLRPQARRVGYMFQDYALFPTMTVEQNIACGLRARRGAAQADTLLADFGLTELRARLPRQLSGGQRQRVALARMLAADPEVILLDEPFSALDDHLREQTQQQLTEALQGCQDVIMVTHNRSEAYRLCSQIMLLGGGRVLAQGGTGALFQRPATVQVARLIGVKNLSPIRRISEREVEALSWGLHLRTAAPVGDEITHVGVRAHDLVPGYGGPPPCGNAFPVLARNQVEDLFEWDLLYKNAEVPTGENLWWKVAKSSYQGPPDHLAIPPDALLLLEDR